MSFEMEYDKHGVAIAAKNVEVIVEEPETIEVTEEVQEVIQKEEPVEQPEEPQQESEPEEEVVQAPTKKDVRDSWSDLRNAKSQAERRARELEEELLNVKRTSQKVAPEVKSSFSLDEDALVEGRHLSAVERKLQAMEEKIAQYEQQSTNSRIEMQLKQEYPDFDSVVSASNLKKLQDSYPDLAATLFAGSDLRAKGSSAYIMIKKLGIIPEDRQNIVDKAQALRNANKPRPVSSISPQNNNSPLSKIQTFTQDTEMTPELQDHLIKEMNAAIKRRGQ